MRADFNSLIYVQKVDLPTSFTKLNENCGLPDFLRISRFVILVIRPYYQKFGLRSTPVKPTFGEHPAKYKYYSLTVHIISNHSH